MHPLPAPRSPTPPLPAPAPAPRERRLASGPKVRRLFAVSAVRGKVRRPVRLPLRLRLRRPRAVVAAFAACVALLGLGAFFAAAAVSMPACNNGDAGGITPITGIIVLSETVAEGHGCGTGAQQIYKYTSVVTTVPEGGAPPQFVAGGTSDCFADETFTNLCASSTGSTPFALEVYGFSENDWNAALGDNAQAYLPKGASSLDPLAPPQAGSACEDGGVLPDLGTLTTDLARHATLVFACSATQQTNVPVLAGCTQTFPGPATTGPSPGDAGMGDAGTSDAGAGDAGAGDTGAGDTGTDGGAS